nr:hypothetical protein [Echinothamnion sp.]
MIFLHYISYPNYISLKIETFYKKYIYLITLTTFIFLIILPYISINTLIVLRLLVKIIFIVLFGKKYINKLLKVSQQVLHFLINALIINYFIDDNNTSQLSTISIFFIYNLKTILLSYSNKFIFKLYFNYMYYRILKYLQKIIIIHGAYLFLFNDISIFIKHEKINKILLVTYVKINKIKLYSYNISLFNIMINNQILERIINNIKNIHFAIKIKKNNISKKELITNTICYTNKFFNQLLKDQNNISITLWIRCIKTKFNNKIYID